MLTRKAAQHPNDWYENVPLKASRWLPSLVRCVEVREWGRGIRVGQEGEVGRYQNDPNKDKHVATSQ